MPNAIEMLPKELFRRVQARCVGKKLEEAIAGKKRSEQTRLSNASRGSNDQGCRSHRL